MRIKTMCRETVSRKVVSIVQAQNPLATCQNDSYSTFNRFSRFSITSDLSLSPFSSCTINEKFDLY
ncbi:hypothetical protein NC652_003090 [Populus alba x Populus x berolinensis]|nr:hypothetical protein NC652_003090 [Populus alba x Populus x berolinensis]